MAKARCARHPPTASFASPFSIHALAVQMLSLSYPEVLMYRLLVFVGVLALLSPTLARAVPLWPPMDTRTFVTKSKDILIVRCINPDVLGGGKNDGLTLVEVEVVVVVKGDRKAGKTRLGTIGQPMEAGRGYLMASFGGNV